MSKRRAFIAAAAGVSLLALPAIGLGDITGTVFRDYNSNGVMDPGGFVSGTGVSAKDTGVENVTVRAFDNTGATVGSATTTADGTYSLVSTAGGTVRVEFTTPQGFQPSFKGVGSATSVQFVSSNATGVNYSINVPTEYCQDNPKIVTCLQPATNQMTQFPSAKGVVSFPGAFTAAQTFSSAGGTTSADNTALEAGVTTVAPMADIGATFGVGVDRSGNAYFGTYVKRHSPYGPGTTGFNAQTYDGDANWIYRVNVATGATTPWVKLGTEQLPAHSAIVPGGTSFPAYSQDGRRDITVGQSGYSSVYFDVGRAGLGDVDALSDGSALLAVEMTEGDQVSTWPRLWHVPINANGSAGAPVDTDITKPATFNNVACLGKWHPMGIGIRGGRVLIGGVCGAEAENAFVDATTGRTKAAAFILEATRAQQGSTYTFATIAAFSLDYPKGGSGAGATIVPVSPTTNNIPGLWSNWHDGPAPGLFAGRPKPMLANIEIMDDGDLTIALRDRFMDQVKPCGTVWFEWTPSMSTNVGSMQQGCQIGGAAEILRLCKTANGYEREQAAACNGVIGANVPQILSAAPNTGASTNRTNSPLYYGAAYLQSPDSLVHAYTGLGGATTMPGSPVVWSTAYDISDIYQQGAKALGACAARTGEGSCGPAGATDGALLGGAVLRSRGNSSAPQPDTSYNFYKGNGLGDLEIVCDAAPLQIGNRIWIDSNQNGLQDPGEPPVAGITVSLWDTNFTNSLVGRAITDAQGTYYFQSNVTKPATGDGTNVGGGLMPGEAFTLRLDNPANFAVGGPLAGYDLTLGNRTSSNPDAQSTAINSKATLSGSTPRISVAAHASGFNDHTFDAGFIRNFQLYGMGDYTWIDSNKNGIQDPDEPPLAGVVVQLLKPDGTPAVDHNGLPVAPVTTDANGYYFIQNLDAGDYKAQFTLPSGQGYSFTTANAGAPGDESRPVATDANPLIGVTAVFTIATGAAGETTAVTEPYADFANLTIDAGVIVTPVTPEGGGADSTPVGMGDYTWIDTNRNGIQDPGELPLPGVSVQLLNPDGSIAKDITGAPVAPVVTDITGHYLVVNLKPGSYMARFTIPTGYTFTTPLAGAAGTDSNPNVFSGSFIGTTPVFQIAASATGNTTVFVGNPKALFANLTIDAGVVPLVAIGDYVWYDTTKDGVQGKREKPVKGAKVYLLNPDGSRAKTAYGKVAPVLSTNAKGKYLFDSLLPGSYKVRFIYPRGYAGTISKKGTAKNDSNPKSTPLNHRVAITPVFTVYDKTQGQTIPQTNPKVNAKFIDPTIDAGIVLDSYSTYVVTG